ncbi:MAG: OmpA family protein [Agarilytica sp.]
MVTSASAALYTNAINDSSWRAQTSVFQCSLEHEVPLFGKAVFRTRAGETSNFYLKTHAAKFDAGNAAVYAKAPVWKADGMGEESVESLGHVSVKRGTRPMWLGTQNAEKMMSELGAGNEIEFMRKAWFEDEGNPHVRLVLSNIGFQKAYKSYVNCLASLLPRNFDQMKRSALYFPAGPVEENDGMRGENLRKLDHVLALVKHDNKVRQFFIDGHTSSPGDRADNLELSKQRAEMVAEYLTRRGIPEEWIQVRWHGERYPVATNATSSGRAKNRRVTLRVERVEEVEVLPLAANE